jgi:hypothetical protein
MKKIIIIISIFLLSSCVNWQYKEFSYPMCKKLEPVHVHLYDHNQCEWSCLELDSKNFIFIDTIKIRYKTNKNGKIKKLKLIN